MQHRALTRQYTGDTGVRTDLAKRPWKTLFGASMGAINVVMNVQALLAKRGILSDLLATLGKAGTTVLTADEPPQTGDGIRHVTRR